MNSLQISGLLLERERGGRRPLVPSVLQSSGLWASPTPLAWAFAIMLRIWQWVTAERASSWSTFSFLDALGLYSKHPSTLILKKSCFCILTIFVLLCMVLLFKKKKAYSFLFQRLAWNRSIPISSFDHNSPKDVRPESTSRQHLSIFTYSYRYTHTLWKMDADLANGLLFGLADNQLYLRYSLLENENMEVKIIHRNSPSSFLMSPETIEPNY